METSLPVDAPLAYAPRLSQRWLDPLSLRHMGRAMSFSTPTRRFRSASGNRFLPSGLADRAVQPLARPDWADRLGSRTRRLALALLTHRIGSVFACGMIRASEVS